MVSSFTDDFNVTWKDPADARLTWLYDPMHFPRPMLPLVSELIDRMYSNFMSARTAFVNGYAFTTGMHPRPPTPEILQRGAFDVWSKDLQPRLQTEVERLRSTDYDRLSLTELGDQAEQLILDAAQAYGFTMVVISGFMGPTFGLIQFLEEELGEEGPQLAATLLQGFANDTAAAGAGLDELAQKAAGLPAVAEVLRSSNFESLKSVEGGPEFLRSFHNYLDAYGWRVETWGVMHEPTWSENPRLPLMLIGRYLAEPERAPATAMRRAVLQREQTEREIESRLSGEKLRKFHILLAAAQAHVAISEGRALWQLITVGSTRVPFLALGRKLVTAGAFEQPDDVFFFTTHELREAARKPSMAVKDTVKQRRSDYELWGKLQPPPFIGTAPDPTQVPPEMQPILRLFFGAGPPRVEGRELKGQAASKGLVHGRARVIHDLSDSERLQPGDILVCQMTTPPWTPLFAIAAGVVTDTGGVLSHSAICAREYAIPCVVGTQVATSMIPDGAMITVDGGKGLVQIDA